MADITGFSVGSGILQLMALANIRAQVVFPTPLGPQNKKACASCLFRMAFFNVVVICDCPTTVEKSCGLYFLAETMNLFITFTSGIYPVCNDNKDLENGMSFKFNRPVENISISL